MAVLKQQEIEVIVARCFDEAITFALVGRDSGDTMEAATARAVEAVRTRLIDADVFVQRKRRAVVEGARHLATIESYLPANYSARVTTSTDDAFGRTSDDAAAFIVIEGYDLAGWTLDTYVLPRLASGLIVGREVAPA
jgi:hypothetical protein